MFDHPPPINPTSTNRGQTVKDAILPATFADQPGAKILHRHSERQNKLNYAYHGMALGAITVLASILPFSEINDASASMQIFYGTVGTVEILMGVNLFTYATRQACYAYMMPETR